MSPVPLEGTYREPMIQVLTVLVLFVLAFFALTILGRRSWTGLGLRESLLGRLAGASVLAAIASPAANTVPFTVLSIVSRSYGVGVEITQTQAIVAVLVGLGLTGAAVARIESYHRRTLGPAALPDADEWEIETPGPLGRRRTP
jgi:hypothetical protein